MFDDAHLIVQTGNTSGTEWTGSAPIIKPEPWTQEALCAETDPEIFFPSKGDKEAVVLARTVCAECPVAAQCLDYALRMNETHGVWGGLSPKQRAQLRNGRKKPARECTENGCARAHKARGLCAMHYAQEKKEGTL